MNNVMKIFFQHFCLCTIFFLPSCSSSSMILKKRVEQSSAAFENGDVLKSYRLLKNHLNKEELSEAPPALKSRYEKLDTAVTNALEFLIEKWLSKAEELFANKDISGALRYYDDLLGNLPGNDDVRKIIQKESEHVRKKQVAMRARYLQLLEDAQREFASGNISRAREKILIAQKSVEKWNLKLPLDGQRLLEECNRRLPAHDSKHVDVPGNADTSAGQAATEDSKPVHRARLSLKDRIKHRRHTGRKKVDENKVTARDKVEKSYRMALKFEKEGKDLKALKAFLHVIKLQPVHAGAKAGLRRLELARKRLIEKWLKIASEFFAKEDLESAAPYYKKVLKLDPGNVRATEGLQMYLRLKQLKKNQK